MKRLLMIVSFLIFPLMLSTQSYAENGAVTEEAAAAQLVDESGQPLQGQALVDAVLALIASVDSTDAQSIKAILTAAFKIADDATAAMITQAAQEAGVPPGLIVASAQNANKPVRNAKKTSNPTPQKSADTPPASYSNASSYGTGGS